MFQAKISKQHFKFSITMTFAIAIMCNYLLSQIKTSTKLFCNKSSSNQKYFLLPDDFDLYNQK